MFPLGKMGGFRISFSPLFANAIERPISTAQYQLNSARLAVFALSLANKIPGAACFVVAVPS